MTALFNFQINPLDHMQPWDQVPAHRREFPDRVTAVQFAKKIARLFAAEIRLTEGGDPLKLSGSYFRGDE